MKKNRDNQFFKRRKSRNLIALFMVGILLLGQMAMIGPSYATTFYLEPQISSIDGNTVKLNYEGSGLGTCYYVVTAYDTPNLEPDEIVMTTSTTATVLAYGSIQDTGGRINSSFSIAAGTYINGGHYKLQAVYKDTSGVSAVTTKGFYKGGLLEGVNITRTYANGFVQKFITYAPGTVYSGIFDTNASVTSSYLLNDNYAIKRAYSATTGLTEQAIAIKKDSTTALGTSSTYKVYSLFMDADNVMHFNADGTMAQSSELKVKDNSLLSVYYDNGASSDATDDKVVLSFAYPVGSTGGADNYELYFDNQASTFSTADITLSNAAGDFAGVTVSENKVEIALSNSALSKINSGDSFDNGVMRASVVNPNLLAPQLNSQTKTADVSLSNNTILYEVDSAPQLTKLQYDNNSTAQDYTDDKFVMTFSSAISSVGTLTLNADDNSSGEYLAADTTFIEGTDYSTSGGNGTEVTLSLNAQGAEKFSKLVNPSFKVGIQNLTWGSTSLDPSITAAYLHVETDAGKLTGLKVDEVAVTSFNVNTTEYGSVPISSGSSSLNQSGGAGAGSCINLTSEGGLLPVEIHYTTGSTAGSILVNYSNNISQTYYLYFDVKQYTIRAILIDNVPMSGITKFGTTFSQSVLSNVTTPNVKLILDNTQWVLGSDYTLTETGSLPGSKVYTWAFPNGGRSVTLTLNTQSTSGKDRGDLITSTPVVETPITPVESSEPIDIVKKIKEANTTLDQMASSTHELDANELIKVVNDLNRYIAMTKDEKTLGNVLVVLSQTVGRLNEILKKDAALNDQLMPLTTSEVTMLTQSIESRLSTLGTLKELEVGLNAYVMSLYRIKLDSGLKSTVLDQSVQDILNKAIAISGTISVAHLNASTPVRLSDISKALESQNLVYKAFKTLADTYFEDTNCRVLQREIVLKTDESPKNGSIRPIQPRNIEMTIEPKAISALMGNQIKQLTITNQGVGLGVTSNNFNASSGLAVQMDLGPSKELLNQPTVSFNLTQNSGKPLVISQPVKLSFNLNAFGLNNINSNQVAILRFDEDKKIWEEVGGSVDEQSQVISVFRGGLSQYTVMKSNKTLSSANNSWAKAEINAALSKGIIKNANDFNPKDLMTRAEFAMWIANAYGLKSSGKKLPFKDVTKGSPYYESVAASYESGLIGGKSTTIFAPNSVLTADEMAVVIGKTLKKFENKQTSNKVTSKYLAGLKASDTSKWAESDKALLTELGIISAQELANTKGNVTKEMAAAAIMRFYRS